MKASHTNDNLDSDLLSLSRKFWQSRVGRELSSEDARQIAANVTGFFSVLAEWSRGETPAPANEPRAPTVAGPTQTQA